MLVSVEDLFHRYGERPALNGLALEAEQGERLGILGPNGCGKSTLFRVLATLLSPQQGRVSIGGLDIARHRREARRRLGVVFQTSSLDRRLTVEENLLAQGHLYGLSGPPLRMRALELLESFRLDDRRHDLAGSLSGGLKRKVEIAKALLHRPSLLLLDEASAGLDPAARRELLEVLNHAQREQGLTVLFTTHIMDEAESASRLVLMHHGRAAASGTPASLKEQAPGDVVHFRGAVEGLAQRLRDRFQAEIHEESCDILVRIADGPRFAAAALEAFPRSAAAVEIHRPSLEDAFLHLTGERFHA